MWSSLSKRTRYAAQSYLLELRDGVDEHSKHDGESKMLTQDPLNFYEGHENLMITKFRDTNLSVENHLKENKNNN